MSFLLKSIILLLPLFTIEAFEKPSIKVIASKDQKGSWETYDYPDLNFKIELPKKPEKLHQEIEIPQTNLKIISDTFMVEVGEEMVYLVSVWQYPNEVDLSNPELNLKDGFKGMLSALPNAEVLKSEVFEKDNHKALLFKVKSETIHFQGFLVLVDHVLYQVFAVYKDGTDTTKEIDRFLESFHLIKTETKEASERKGIRALKI